MMYYEEDENKKQIKKKPLEGKFCWAGLIMPQFWGIGNGIWYGLLAFIPIVFPFLAIYFGFNGYNILFERVMSSQSEEQFCNRQKKWNIAAFIYVGVYVILILYIRTLYTSQFR